MTPLTSIVVSEMVGLGINYSSPIYFEKQPPRKAKTMLQ